MSIFDSMETECPACGATCEGDLVASVNADRRPDLRDDILAGTFQAFECPGCGTRVRLAPSFVYMDVGRGQWLMARSIDQAIDWADHERTARMVFDQAYGAGAPAVARDIGAGLVPRLTFGWPAVREKLLCRAEDIDDTTLEVLKAAVMRSVSGAPVSDANELRLDAVDGDDLVLRWMDPATETPSAAVRVPRAALRDIDDADAAWAPLRHDLSQGMFVDLLRLLTG